jgi:hypothetical protein
MVAHTCNSNYFEADIYREDLSSKTARAKSYQDLRISTSKLGVVVHICNPSCVGGICRRSSI